MLTEDVAAARVILGGVVESDTAMADLPGSDQCVHGLFANGQPLESGHIAFASQSLRPYRHHEFTPAGRAPGDTKVCKCQNFDVNPVHQRCWKGE